MTHDDHIVLLNFHKRGTLTTHHSINTYIRFVRHPQRVPIFAVKELVDEWEHHPGTFVCGVDGADLYEFFLFGKAIKQAVSHKEKGVPLRLGIHATTGVYEGEEFDNTINPRAIVVIGRWVLMSETNAMYRTLSLRIPLSLRIH